MHRPSAAETIERAQTLRDELSDLVRDASESLSRSGRGVIKEGKSAARAGYAEGAERLHDGYDAARRTALELGRGARSEMRDRPLTSLAVALGAGLAIASLAALLSDRD